MSKQKVVDIRKTIPRHKTKKYSTRTKIKRLVVHATASNNQDPNKTALWHVNGKDWPGLAYHDTIDKDGVIYHCNSYDLSTYHAKSWNATSVGIALAYKGESLPPPVAQMDALERHLTRLCLFFKILPRFIKGHREAPWMSQVLGNGSVSFRKECPGLQIDLDKLRLNVTKRLQRRLAAECLYKGPIDGLFGKNSQKALYAFEI